MRTASDPELLAMHPAIDMPMLKTAEVVAARYGIGRDRQDAYALQSQQRTAAAQAAGRFDDEIIPVTATMHVMNKETKTVAEKTGLSIWAAFASICAPTTVMTGPHRVVQLDC